jgi:hypothetical protein
LFKDKVCCRPYPFLQAAYSRPPRIAWQGLVYHAWQRGCLPIWATRHAKYGIPSGGRPKS